ncbi:MAG: MMPL family transporter [Gammaproteobacteria bacterium]|nr:MMPL family transporter [Gammaproteobacteria bacterium]
MNNKNNNSFAHRYSQWVVRWRWPIVILTLALAIGAGSGVKNLGFNTDYRVFFSEDNPQMQAFEALQRTYTKVDNILFTLAPRDDADVFTPSTLAAVEQVTEQAWLLPFALRVDSISNFQHTVAEGDDLIVEDLVFDALNLDQAALDNIKAVALSEPALHKRLVANEGGTTGINVTFQLPGKAMDEVPIAAAAARALAAEIEANYPIDVHLVGMMMMNNSFMESSQNDMASLVPIMYLVIIIITFFLVRSFSATIGTLIIIVMSVITAMGIAGWLGVKLTPPSASAPTIIMTLVVADSIHILATLLALMRNGTEKRAAIAESLRINLSPVFLTSITTAIGFLSLNFSDSPPFHDLGNITAIGVMAAFVYSVTFLPAFLAIMPLKVSQRPDRMTLAMDRLASVVVKRRKSILWSSVIVSLIILSFIPRIELNDDFVAYFDTSTDYRQDVDFTTANLTGIYQLQYSLPTHSSNGISDPEFLAELDAFSQWLRSQPEVMHVNTISDTFKRLNKNLHGDDNAWYRLPESRALAAQYLLLYELSLPYGLDLNNQLNVDKSSTQVIATLDNMTSKQLRDIALRGEQWLAENTRNSRAIGVGPGIMFAYISERNITSMLGGTFAAVILISFIIMFALRSFKIGMLSLIPNLLPAGLAFGIWGLMVGQVNMAVSMVAGMSLGIVVDDTVHFLSKYLRARREKGMDAEAAVRHAFSSVGVAIVMTSVILVAGFMVLAQSTFGLNSQMALLTGIAIVMAIIADLLLLPALLMRLDTKKLTIKTKKQAIIKNATQGDNA